MSKRPLTPTEIAHVQRVLQAAAEGTHYDVLQVDLSAAADEVAAAYNDYVRSWHPDRFYSRDTGIHGPAIEEAFVHVTTAFRTLKDERKRAAYDREIAAQGRRPEARPTKSQVSVAPPVHEVTLNRGPRGLQPERPPSQVDAPPPAPPKVTPAAVKRAQDMIAQQFAKARQYYESGQAEVRQGQWAKAEAALYLATRYDPKNAQYQAAWREAGQRAREQRAQHFWALAEQAESYARYKEAIDALHKAAECDPPEGRVWAKLARLLLANDDDVRGAVDALRRAVQKEPANQAFRVSLAEVYERAGLKANAAREWKIVLEADPKNANAKAAIKRLTA